MLMVAGSTRVGVWNGGGSIFATSTDEMLTDPGTIEIYSVISGASGTVGRQTGRGGTYEGAVSVQMADLFGEALSLGAYFGLQPYGEVNELVVFRGVQDVASVVERLEADMLAAYLLPCKW